MESKAAESQVERADLGAAPLAEPSLGTGGKLNSFVFGLAAFAALGNVLYGYNQGVMAVILDMPQFLDQFPEIDATKSSQASFLKGLMTAIVEFGAIFGSLSCGFLADKYSRKRTIFFGSIGFMIGLVLQIASQNYAMLVIGRFLSGWGIGVFSMIAPLYVSELAPTKWRGALLAMAGWSILVGTSISFWISYGTRFIDSSWCFRLPFALQLIPAIGLAAGTFLLPFSPRWLAAQDRQEEGLAVLCRLRGCAPGHPDEATMVEWTEILIAVQLDRSALADKHGDVTPGSLQWELLRWRDLFSTRAMLRRFIVTCGLFWFQQLGGIDALLYYGPSFFESLNYDTTDQLNWSGIINCMNLAGGTTTIFTTDRFGRKKLLLAGAVIITSCHAVLAGLIGAESSNWAAHQDAAKAGVAMLVIFMFFQGATFGPTPAVVCNEIFPYRHRARGVAFGIANEWLANFTVGLISPALLAKSAWGTFVFFGACTFLSFFFVLFVVPETKGVLLETMDIIFKDRAADEDAKMRATIEAELRPGFRPASAHLSITAA
ncbi:MFS sugar transporter-like protein [Xylariales sp. PMI_506]|nr:MFS sugar transporter-like protein [Xylariales sp. PMI_506]